MKKIKYSSAAIASKEVMAKTLSLEIKTLEELEKNIVSNYNFFSQPKKNSTELRDITAPKPFLMQVQRRINARVFSHLTFPNYLQGSIKDKITPRDFLSNAIAHKSAKTVITLDIRNFYPSITTKEVFKIFKYLCKFKDEVASTLTNLVTLNGSLPQGAPTSSYIANMIFYDLEPKLVTTLKQHNINYTRLLDDITLSFSSKRDLDELKSKAIGMVRNMCTVKSLQLHDGKQQIVSTWESSSPAAVVTGITIKKGKVGLTRQYRDKVRAKVHNCLKSYQAGNQTTMDYHRLHNSTLGDVTLLKRLNYSQAEGFAKTLKACAPTYSSQKASYIHRACKDLTLKLRASTLDQQTRRYYVLNHCLTVLARTKPKLAKKLRKELTEAFVKVKSHDSSI